MEYERRTMRMTDETLRVNHSFAGRYRPRKYGCYRHNWSDKVKKEFLHAAKIERRLEAVDHNRRQTIEGPARQRKRSQGENRIADIP